MRKRSRKPSDPNSLAAAIVNEVTQSDRESVPKNPAAVALGRLGGLKGGPARAKKLTAKERSDSASKAASMRWETLRFNKRKKRS